MARMGGAKRIDSKPVDSKAVDDGVYVIGVGAVSAAGFTAEDCASAMRKGTRTFMAPLQYLDSVLELPVGEVRMSNKCLAEYVRVSSLRVSRTALLGIIAARDAMQLNPWFQTSHNIPFGFFSGNSVGGMDLSEVFWQANRENPRGGDVGMLRMHTPGSVTDAIADYLEEELDYELALSTTVSTACSAAGNAIMMAARMIQSGQLGLALAGGTDSLCKFTLNGFNSLRILDKDVCRPFDAGRNGLNLGEGAGYLLLAGSSVVKKMTRAPYCKLTGWGNANEAYHQTASTPEGIGPGLAMTAALEKSGLAPSDISFINTHGTGTSVNDLAESNAMLRVFDGKVPPFSSMKSVIGHTLGASEGIEAALMCLALKDNDSSFLSTRNFSNPITETGLRPYDGAEPIDLKNIMSSAYGFSGNCSSLIFSRL